MIKIYINIQIIDQNIYLKKSCNYNTLLKHNIVLKLKIFIKPLRCTSYKYIENIVLIEFSSVICTLQE